MKLEVQRGSGWIRAASKERRTAPEERRGDARQFLQWGRNALACAVRCCFKGKANGPLGKKGERPPILPLGSECAGLRRALLLQREGERPLRKEGGTLANFYIGVEMYWLASCVASAGGAVVVIRPSSKNQ